MNQGRRGSVGSPSADSAEGAEWGLFFTLLGHRREIGRVEVLAVGSETGG